MRKEAAMGYHRIHQLSPENARLLSRLQSSDPACQGYSPEPWYSDNDDTEAQDFAKGVCATCPAIELCLEYAISAREVGIWGGLTWKERQQLRHFTAAG